MSQIYKIFACSLKHLEINIIQTETLPEIDWLPNLDENLVDYVEQIIEWDKDKYAGFSKKCLLVSGMYEETQVLLFPTRDHDWECWSLTLGGGCGETWFPSFRYYMEHQLYFL